MRALHTFTVRPRIPEPLAALEELAMNLRWSWDARTRDLFRWVDTAIWEQSGGDPVALLGQVGAGRLEELTRDTAFMAFLSEVQLDLRRYLESPLWFQGRKASPLR